LKIEGWTARWLVAFGVFLLKIWGRTLRYEVDDQAGVVGQPVIENYIGALWHNRLLLIGFILQKYIPQRPNTLLVSASRDGELLAEAMKRFGFAAVRGSSSRLGATAILQLTDVLASGRDMGITPDGPLGPVYELGPGIVFLAQKANIGVVPVHVEYSSFWRLKSWDKFLIPRPFCKARVTFGPVHRVKPTNTPEEFEAERLRLQDEMMSLVQTR
jgi:lysophospholipid acyltransferase (LPLAT)-like uncharacterized protein